MSKREIGKSKRARRKRDSSREWTERSSRTVQTRGGASRRKGVVQTRGGASRRKGVLAPPAPPPTWLLIS